MRSSELQQHQFRCIASKDVKITYIWLLDIDTSEFTMDAADKLDGDQDFIFYNQPHSSEFMVEYTGKSIALRKKKLII